mgnify:CR=1 FL=1
MRGVSGSSPEPRPDVVARGMAYVLGCAYADGYDQGRFGLRYPSGRVEWGEPRPPKGFRDLPGVTARWWEGWHAGKRAREEFDAQVEVASGPEADGPVGAQGVLAPRPGVEADPHGTRGPGRRGGDAAPSRGVVGLGVAGRDEARSGVPVDPRLTRVGVGA